MRKMKFIVGQPFCHGVQPKTSGCMCTCVLQLFDYGSRDLSVVA